MRVHLLCLTGLASLVAYDSCTWQSRRAGIQLSTSSNYNTLNPKPGTLNLHLKMQILNAKP